MATHTHLSTVRSPAAMVTARQPSMVAKTVKFTANGAAASKTAAPAPAPAPASAPKTAPAKTLLGGIPAVQPAQLKAHDPDEPPAKMMRVDEPSPRKQVPSVVESEAEEDVGSDGGDAEHDEDQPMEVDGAAKAGKPRVEDDDDTESLVADEDGKKPSTAVKPRTPAKQPTKLPDAFYEKVAAGVGSEDGIPMDVLVPVASHMTDKKMPVVFICTAGQGDEIKVLEALPRSKLPPSTVVFGLYLIYDALYEDPQTGEKGRRIVLPGTAAIVQKKSDDPRTRLAYVVPGIGEKACLTDDAPLAKQLDDLFDGMTIDNIPSLMTSSPTKQTLDAGAELFNLLNDESDDADSLVSLLMPSRTARGMTPFSCVVEDDRRTRDVLVGALEFVFPYLTDKSKPAARKPRAPKAEPAGNIHAAGQKKAAKIPAAGLQQVPAPSKKTASSSMTPKATDDVAEVTAKADAAPKQMEVDAKKKPTAAKAAAPVTAKERAAPKQTVSPAAPRVSEQRADRDIIVIAPPKGFLDTLIVPIAAVRELPTLMTLVERTVLCDDGSFELKLATAQLSADIVERLRAEMLRKEAYGCVKEIRGQPVDFSGIGIDTKDHTNPITVVHPNGTSCTGTLVDFAGPRNHVYETVIELVKEAHMMWMTSSRLVNEDDMEEEEDDDDDDEEEEDDDE